MKAFLASAFIKILSYNHNNNYFIVSLQSIGVSRGGGGSGGPDPPLFLDPPFPSVTPLQPNPISQTNVM